jgi:hypothetical protein
VLRYDANINGPIVKKKLWFFLDANYESQQQTQPVLAYLPSGVLQTDTLSPVTTDQEALEAQASFLDQHLG